MRRLTGHLLPLGNQDMAPPVGVSKQERMSAREICNSILNSKVWTLVCGKIITGIVQGNLHIERVYDIADAGYDSNRRQKKLPHSIVF